MRIVASLKEDVSRNSCKSFRVITSWKQVVPPYSKVFLPIEAVEPNRSVNSCIVESQGKQKGLSASGSSSEEMGYNYAINDSSHFVSVTAGTEIGSDVHLGTMITTEAENIELPDTRST